MVKNLLNLVFPKLCCACSDVLSDNEDEICTSCRHDLPLANYRDHSKNTMTAMFAGRVEIDMASALFRFQKRGRIQNILHNLKYRGMEQLGPYFGSWMGHELKRSGTFNSIDMVIPVPLHKKKKRLRGYNQVSGFARAIAKPLEASFREDILVKTSATSTQVFKRRKSRWQGKNFGFELKNPDIIRGKHILIVDDLITTGSTLEACANTLRRDTNIQISLATLAIAE